MNTLRFLLVLAFCATSAVNAAPLRSFHFQAATPHEAGLWREKSRSRLFELMMGGKKPDAVALEPKILQRIDMPAGGYVLEELTLQTLTEPTGPGNGIDEIDKTADAPSIASTSASFLPS